MRIEWVGKYLKIFTQTTKEQKAVLAMIMVFILEVYALSKGFNADVLRYAMAILAGLGGYVLGAKTKKKEEEAEE